MFTKSIKIGHSIFIAKMYIFKNSKIVLSNNSKNAQRGDGLKVLNISYIISNNTKLYIIQGYNARKVNCSCVYTALHIETNWAEFVNKNRCISVRLVSEEVKSIKF